jgi:hypothetical protein
LLVKEKVKGGCCAKMYGREYTILDSIVGECRNSSIRTKVTNYTGEGKKIKDTMSTLPPIE